MSADRHITLAHGAGGELTGTLIREVFATRLDNAWLAPLSDAALIDPGDAPQGLALTTDSFVISPLFFPGGDIGSLAVSGTVNDLAVAGAVPRFLSLAVILEEGFPLPDLERIVASIAATATAAHVAVVTGDTKVVERGKGDGLFINTTGVGVVRPEAPPGAQAVTPGDAIIVSGCVGDHGAAVMAARAGIDASSTLTSDAAPLASLIEGVYAAGVRPLFMRDPTRGGAAGVLTELAQAAGVGIALEEAALPVSPEARGLCELLGLDPLYLANEGKVIVVLPADAADRCLDALRAHPLGTNAAVIGTVTDRRPGRLVLRTRYGGQRLVERPTGDPLPRIC